MDEQNKTNEDTKMNHEHELAIKDFESKMKIFLDSGIDMSIDYTLLESNNDDGVNIFYEAHHAYRNSFDIMKNFRDVITNYKNHNKIIINKIKLREIKDGTTLRHQLDWNKPNHYYLCLNIIVSAIKNNN